MTKVLGTIAVASLLLTGCGKYKESIKIMPTEIAQANECKSSDRQMQVDCYDLISYKNSIALIRLGLEDYRKGNYEEALKKYTYAKSKGNFYANSLLADLYNNGKGVPKNQKMAFDLLDDVEDVDPIAAYKLSFYYMGKQEYSDAIELLEFAATNGVKDAQKRLITIYEEGKITKADSKKAQMWKEKYSQKDEDFMQKIYGL